MNTTRDLYDEQPLDALLASTRIPVREGFKDEVLMQAMILDGRIPVREGFKDDVMLEVAILDSRIAIREGFKDDVMAALPGRHATRPHPYLVPVAAMVLMAVAAAGLLSGASLGSTLLGGAGLAIADAFVQATLAGAGLLNVSWTGLGLALEELFGQSGLSLVAFAAAVICLNLLFVSLLRAARREAPSTAPTRHN